MIPDTLLHRQVSPAWVQRGNVTSQAFKPSKKDGGRLSVYDGSLISAEDAWKHFVQALQYRSVGVLAVSVQECVALQLEVEADPDPFEEHAVIDFREVSRRQIERKADALKRHALDRGWQYGPVAMEESP